MSRIIVNPIESWPDDEVRSAVKELNLLDVPYGHWVLTGSIVNRAQRYRSPLLL